MGDSCASVGNPLELRMLRQAVARHPTKSRPIRIHCADQIGAQSWRNAQALQAQTTEVKFSHEASQTAS